MAMHSQQQLLCNILEQSFPGTEHLFRAVSQNRCRKGHLSEVGEGVVLSLSGYAEVAVFLDERMVGYCPAAPSKWFLRPLPAQNLVNQAGISVSGIEFNNVLSSGSTSIH